MRLPSRERPRRGARFIGSVETGPTAMPLRADLRLLDGSSSRSSTPRRGAFGLADVLATPREKPSDADNATLTGACIVALGALTSGYYATSDALADKVKVASKEAGESMWHMPLLDELRDGLKSDWADLKHTADRWGGSITAALFLQEFVGDTPWIHCDVAGPVLADRAKGIYPKGATGHPVLTFVNFVESFG